MKRVLATILTICMCVGMLPVSAFSEEVNDVGVPAARKLREAERQARAQYPAARS